MLPLVDIEKVSQKNVVKTQNSQIASENESGGFAEIFNFLSLDKNSKKTESSAKKTPQNTLENNQKSSLDKLSENANKGSNILKSLDEKYNLSKNFSNIQKAESQNKNPKANIQNQNTRALPNTAFNSAKELLEFSKSQKQETKTLKDLKAVAEDLKLNVQKISLQNGEEKVVKNVAKSENLSDKIINPNAKQKALNADLKTEKTSKESSNILGNLLQDKELLKKESQRDSKNYSIKNPKEDSKVETKNSKISKDSQMDLKESNKNVGLNQKKDDKINQDSKAMKSLGGESQDSKVDLKTKSAEIVEDSKVKNAQVKNTQTQKESQKETKEVKEVKADSKVESKTESKEAKESNAKKIESQKAEVNGEIVEDSKVKTAQVKNSQIQKEAKDSKVDPKEAKVDSKEVKNTESKAKESSVKNTQLKDSQSIEKTENTKESLAEKPAQTQSKAQESLKTSQDSKQSFAQKEAQKQENIVEEKIIKEESVKDSKNAKTTKETKFAQDLERNPFIQKEKKEVKDSLLKDNESQKSAKDSKIRTQNTNSFNATLKEENMRQEVKMQDIFLDNLLKTKDSSLQTTKESHREVIAEETKENVEKKAKANQEVFSAQTQAQVESRLSVQNTFLHFSDKLRDALQNYRPPVTKLSLELNPENLGSVELTITKRGDKLSVQIGSNQNALQLFMQNAQEFKNSLNNLGFNDVNLEFKDNAGNSLGSGDFGNSQGGNGGFQEQNPRGHSQQNSEQNSDENTKNAQKWNENSLYIPKEANNPYAKVALVEINFSYIA